MKIYAEQLRSLRMLLLIGHALVLLISPALAGPVENTPVQAQEAITPAHAQSGKYIAYQAWLNRIVLRDSVTGQSDTLSQYAKKCEKATGIKVPSFSCSAGTEVPGQGSIPQSHPPTTKCDHPNVLNSACDPGSKFQVLPGGNADAVAVAHCRKVGKTIAGDLYNDIAVIQYNKKNGATCFYQALTNLPGEKIPAPIDGDSAQWKDGKPHWMNPHDTQGIGCTGCHDNGGFIRSEYLAQLTTPPNVLPNTASGFNNQNTPLKYVGLDYASNRSWGVNVSPAPNDIGLPCNSCHRLAVPNRQVNGQIEGTAAHFANVATAASQASKNSHSPTSPIWMRPKQITHDPNAEASATKFRDCAVAFFNSGFNSGPSGCSYTPLGEPYVAPKQWSDWSDELGAGTFTSGPAAVLTGGGNIHVFACGDDNKLWHSFWGSQKWSGWRSDVGQGTLQSGPGAMVSSAGHIHLFALGDDFNMWHNFWNGKVWSGWRKDMGLGSFKSGPAALVDNSGNIHVFAQGGDRNIWHNFWNGKKWHGWTEELGLGTFNSGPAAVLTGSGNIHVFARGDDNNIWHSYWGNQHWSGWSADLGQGTLTSGPAAVVDNSGDIHVFATGDDRKMWHSFWNHTKWSGWRADMGTGTFQSSPAAIIDSAGHLHVFAEGDDRNIWHSYY